MLTRIYYWNLMKIQKTDVSKLVYVGINTTNLNITTIHKKLPKKLERAQKKIIVQSIKPSTFNVT